MKPVTSFGVRRLLRPIEATLIAAIAAAFFAATPAAAEDMAWASEPEPILKEEPDADLSPAA